MTGFVVFLKVYIYIYMGGGKLNKSDETDKNIKFILDIFYSVQLVSTLGPF